MMYTATSAREAAPGLGIRDPIRGHRLIVPRLIVAPPPPGLRRPARGRPPGPLL
jgi:hypothetical protein